LAVKAVGDAIVKLAWDKQLFPSVGQLIPGSWMELWKLFGATRQCGDDTQASALARKDDAPALGAKKGAPPGGGDYNENASSEESALDVDAQSPPDVEQPSSAEGAYRTKEELRGAWDAHRQNNSIVASEAVFDDALRLLEAQGTVFSDAGLVFLSPTYVTDLMKPLVDHLLTLETAKGPEMRRAVVAFAKKAKKEGGFTGRVNDLFCHLEVFAASGELHGGLLSFLWRDLPELKREHYPLVLKMLADSGKYFHALLLKTTVGGDIYEHLAPCNFFPTT
jgi:hypothetical protein